MIKFVRKRVERNKSLFFIFIRLHQLVFDLLTNVVYQADCVSFFLKTTLLHRGEGDTILLAILLSIGRGGNIQWCIKGVSPWSTGSPLP